MGHDRRVAVRPRKQGLEAVKQRLPDAEPFRAWANFEFRDNRGRWHEVDLLVLARDTLYLIELKHYRGILTGNDHRWRRNKSDRGLAAVAGPPQSPILLFVAQGCDPGAQVATRRSAEPYVQELVFLHHEQFSDLPPNSKINLYGLDGREGITKLPGISKVLLAPASHDPISNRTARSLPGLMRAMAWRRAASVRSARGSSTTSRWPTVTAGQDWRLFTTSTPKTTSESGSTPRLRAPRGRRARAASNRHPWYNLLSRLTYDGLQAPGSG